MDKETFHIGLEVLTGILLPLLVYYVKNTAKEVGHEVGQHVNEMKILNERRFGAIETANAVCLNERVTLVKRIDNLDNDRSTFRRLMERVNEKLDET